MMKKKSREVHHRLEVNDAIILVESVKILRFNVRQKKCFECPECENKSENNNLMPSSCLKTYSTTPSTHELVYLYNKKLL